MREALVAVVVALGLGAGVMATGATACSPSKKSGDPSVAYPATPAGGGGSVYGSASASGAYVGIGGAGDYGELKVAPDGTVMFHGKHGASGAHGKVGLEGGQPRTGVGTC